MSGEPMRQMTRRTFLSAAALAAAAPAFGAAERDRLAADPERPQYHLLPAAGWMNDPNGPIYHRGRYHMFFQHNPHGAVWGDISWGHAVSEDMMHWRHLPVALTPIPDGPDAAGCFTGSCVAVGSRVYAVYTGVVHSSLAEATIRDVSNPLRESQCLAWSDDAMLTRWTKAPKPIVADPPRGLHAAGFRDPSAWRQGDGYWMTVGSGVAGQGGCVLLYHSQDMQQWSYRHPLEPGGGSGAAAANPVDSGEMWECPEFFALDGGHVLIYSTEGKVFWQSGNLDMQAMTFTPARGGQLDVGDYYAPKTQLDAQGRRILWGWIPERRPVAAYNAAGWAGMMSLPRVLSLTPQGELRMQALPALAALRGAPLPVHREAHSAGITLPEANGEVVCTAAVTGGAFAMVVTQGVDGPEILRVEAAAGGLVANGRKVPLDTGEAAKLHLYVDASVACVIVNSRVGYTKRFYSAQRHAPEVVVRATGAELTLAGWRVRPISSNRLTTPA